MNNNNLSIVLRIYIVTLLLSFSPILFAQKDSYSMDQAESHFEKLLKSGKNNALAYYQLAFINYNKGNYSKAIKYCKKIIGKATLYESDCYLIYGSSLEETKRSSEAFEIFEKGALAFPNIYLMQYNYALSCYKYRETKKAITAIEKAIALSPLYAKSHLLYAAILYEANNSSAALLPMFYGLMLDNQSSVCITGLVFAANRINQHHELITVPYYDMRLSIKTIEQLYAFFSPKKVCESFSSEFNASSFVLQAVDYVNTCNTKKENLQIPALYTNFFDQLVKSANSEAFMRYIIRCSGNKENEEWIKAHGNEMNALADWLDKALPSELLY